MTKEIKFLGTGDSADPINQVAGDIAAVFALNGHVSTDDEIRAELNAAAIEPTVENIARVREIAGVE